MKDDYSKIKFFNKSSEDFQIFLASDENELIRLNGVYNSLINNLGLENENNKLFGNKYKIADVLINNGIWEGRILNSDKMEKAIISLSENLNELKEELEQEKKQFKEIKNSLLKQTNNYYFFHN